MKKLILAAYVGALSVNAFAEPELYGKAHIAFHNADIQEGEETSTTELVSNASRIGVKGEIAGNDSVKAIYQFEYETYVDDGDSGDDTTFKQRNIFIGLQGDFGIIKAGHFDTPLKEAQKKIDLFNDQVGDIKNVVTANDQRKSNSVAYKTTTDSPFNAYVALISSEDEEADDGVSASVTFEQNDLYLALAYDTNVAAQDADVIRFVGQYSFSAFQLGALYEEVDVDGESVDGVFVSAGYKMDSWFFKVQAGQSDERFEGGETMSIGFDYKISKPLKVFTYYTVDQSDNDVRDRNYLGAGIEAKF
ncbi:Major outer membrane protein P.IB [Thalassocella blandensis]|nr:Major outer membrane protein P.IB [Thalassocella blandensis]